MGEGASVNAVMNLRVSFNSWNFLTEELLASQEGPCSAEFVYLCVSYDLSINTDCFSTYRAPAELCNGHTV